MGQQPSYAPSGVVRPMMPIGAMAMRFFISSVLIRTGSNSLGKETIVHSSFCLVKKRITALVEGDAVLAVTLQHFK